MKRLSLIAVSVMASAMAVAQNTYQNDLLVGQGDVFGTARYVGMGGAMGALGADMSVMGYNPAGIGLYRKSDVSLTAGAVIPQGTNGYSNAVDPNHKLAKAVFDQCGVVWSLNMGNSSKLSYLNVGFNYQKKANFNSGFFADHANLGGLSQMDQLAELCQNGFDTNNNLAGLAYDADFLDKDVNVDDDGNEVSRNSVSNAYGGEYSQTTRHTRGSLQGFDFNLSFNIQDRVYLGGTFGFDNLNNLSWTEYGEANSYYDADDNQVYGDYRLYNDTEIRGFGINSKLGIIVRPIESNSLRVGLAIETPTWYRLRNSTYFDLTDDVTGDRTSSVESYLEYTLKSPCKTRFSIGSTVGNNFAWDVEYELANYAKTSMGYPKWDSNDPDHSSFSNTRDIYMNALTKNVLKAQHTLRAGVEYRPVSSVALRLGYNFITSHYEKNVGFDQYTLADGDGSGYSYSSAMDYATSTDYMRMGATNILTLGAGYKYKKFYIDLAYKFRTQGAKYWAFDTAYTGGTDFATAYPELADTDIDPVKMTLNQHTLTCTLGFKF